MNGAVAPCVVGRGPDRDVLFVKAMQCQTGSLSKYHWIKEAGNYYIRQAALGWGGIVL